MRKRYNVNIRAAFAKRWIAAILLVGICIPVLAEDRYAEDLARYERETDPVRKARALAKLGESQIDLARKQLKDDLDEASLATLQKYLEEVQATDAMLKATGNDPERKPSGFKELQISLRENVRRIDDLILTLPADKRPFFRAVRTDLVAVQNELIDALFPRQPGRGTNKTNP